MTAERDSIGEGSELAKLGLIQEDSTGLVVDVRTGEPLVASRDTGAPVPFMDLVGTYRSKRDHLIGAMSIVVDRGDFILGAAVEDFELDFADYCDVHHAVGVDSGFSALELIMRGMGIGHGDEVITAANTFIATVNAIHHCGATPVLVDMDPESYNVDVQQLEAAVTSRTAAIIAVHLYGRPAEMEALRRIADRHGLVLIEDAAQAHGAKYLGRRTGGLGDAAAFSFYPSKNLGAFGDAGMVVTQDEELARKIRVLRNVGQVEKNHHEVPGFNRRLDSLQAVVLQVRLESLDEENEARHRHAMLYGALLEGAPLLVPAVSPKTEELDHVYHLYVIQTEERDALAEHLGERRIATAIHYPIPVHLQPAYDHLPYRPGAFPITEAAAKRILSLPMYPGLTTEATARVALSVRDFFGV